MGGEIKPNCPPPLKAPDLPTRTNIQMAINTFRTSLNGHTLTKLGPDAYQVTQQPGTTVPWVYFYVPFLAKDLDPYLEYLQFVKNYSTNHASA